MPEVTVRPEQESERPVVADVVRLAFAHHEGVDRLLDDLRQSDAWLGLSFVATSADAGVVGHVAFTRSRLDAPDRLVDVLVLSPLSVLPSAQGAGVGTTLVARALELLEGRPEPLVFLEGSPRYYPRFGFVGGATRGFRRPSLRIPEPAFQVRSLPSDPGDLSGTLVYHRLWWDHNAVGLRGERLAAHSAAASSETGESG